MNAKKTIRQRLSELLILASKTLDEPHLNGSLCLIFNGMASMIAIVFIVLFFMGKTNTLLTLGIIGCVAMILANITDMIPFWLSRASRKIER